VRTDYQKREPSPPPHAVNLRHSGLPHRGELGLNSGKSILWVIIGAANEIPELTMEFGRG